MVLGEFFTNTSSYTKKCQYHQYIDTSLLIRWWTSKIFHFIATKNLHKNNSNRAFRNFVVNRHLLTKFDEAVGPSCWCNLSAILSVEFSSKVFKICESSLFAEALITQTQVAHLTINQVTANKRGLHTEGKH